MSSPLIPTRKVSFVCPLLKWRELRGLSFFDLQKRHSLQQQTVNYTKIMHDISFPLAVNDNSSGPEVDTASTQAPTPDPLLGRAFPSRDRAWSRVMLGSRGARADNNFFLLVTRQNGNLPAKFLIL